MNQLKAMLKQALPAPLFTAALSAYHYALAYLGAILYGFPSRKLIVIGVTGTNGKSTTTEFINAIFERAGYTTALSNSIRVKVGAQSGPATGRSMPGRFFIQSLLARAVREGCKVAIIEMTSEGARQHRHRGIALDCLVFTNLAPEHIESHGSFEAYANAKYELGLSLARSSKRPRIMVANADDAQGARYLLLPVEIPIGFSLSKNAPWNADEHGGSFTFMDVPMAVHVPGAFNVANALAAAEVARAFRISALDIQQGIASLRNVPGRMESIEAGQKFSVVVDYALTPDALEALYKTYADRKKICVFGSAGGGRDKWKRPILGQVAEKYCEEVILTNDIAYDEAPDAIVADIANGMKAKPSIIMDRRAAIGRAIELAAEKQPQEQAVVLITGMGIDNELTSADGKKIPWSDAQVAREEIERVRSLKRV